MSEAEDDDDDDEEERPLAARVTRTADKRKKDSIGKPLTGQRSGKHKTSKKAKASTAPANLPPPTDEEREEMRHVNGLNGRDARVKVEDKMDEGQLSRLATGVTVDAAGPASAAVRHLAY